MNSMEKAMERLNCDGGIASERDVVTVVLAAIAMEMKDGGIASEREVVTLLSMADSKESTGSSRILVEQVPGSAGVLPAQRLGWPRSQTTPQNFSKNQSTKLQFAPEIKAELQLNFKALALAGYLTPNTMQGDLAEEYRFLKRPLLMNASSKQDEQLKYGNLIAITSALPGEGKTFTSFNLAMSIALERDNTVLLIDSDLTKRSLTGLVGLNAALGLTDVLLNPQIDLRDIIVSTNVPKLKFIPAGRTHPDATELLASEQMHAMTCELSARYSDRIVLFDAPPLLTTGQAMILTALMGQILVVVEEGKTPQPVIQEAVSLLDEDKVIGMVLNRCHRLFGSKRYGGYY
jgi:exopolysaccharide/PEP-CTERM locus tyrosine autokinase